MTDKPTNDQAEEAVRVLLRWMGEDPERHGLKRTPLRVLKSYADWFSGYNEDPAELLGTSFAEADGYTDPVILRDIRFESHCEHHIAPFIGYAHVAYMPDRRLVGVSKIVRVVNAYAKRLQVQERLTHEIGDCIQNALQPKGVAVVLRAQHECMTTRGVYKPDISMVTQHFTGIYKDDPELAARFLNSVQRQ